MSVKTVSGIAGASIKALLSTSAASVKTWDGESFSSVMPLSIITSAQTGTVVITSGLTTNTASITAVDPDNSVVIFGGQSGASANTVGNNFFSYLELDDASTVRATRKGTTGILTVQYTVLEFTSDAMAAVVQKGIIDITSGTTGTDTITAVGSTAVVLYLGSCSTSTGTSGVHSCSVELTDSTTITATAGVSVSSNTLTVSYMVLELTTDIVQSVQQRTVTDTAAVTFYDDTITSVEPSRTILLPNGYQGTSMYQWAHALELTSSTNVRLTRNSASTTSRTVKYTVLQFQLGVLKSAVQRGVIRENDNDAGEDITISAVVLAKSVCKHTGWTADSSTAFRESVGRVLFTSTTNVRLYIGDPDENAHARGAYEVFEFN